MPVVRRDPTVAGLEQGKDGVADTEAAPVTAAMTETAAEGAEPARATLGEVDIEKAAAKLIATGAARAIFVSPEGDEAAASAVLVAREVSDTGLRVLLL